MEAAIWLSSLPAKPSASATEHEDLPEFSKGSLTRNETHSFTIYHLLSIWGHKALFPLLLPLSQLMQWHHTALDRYPCLKTGTLKLLEYTWKLKNVRFLHFQQSPLICSCPVAWFRGTGRYKDIMAGYSCQQQKSHLQQDWAETQQKKKSNQKWWVFVPNTHSYLHMAGGWNRKKEGEKFLQLSFYVQQSFSG